MERPLEKALIRPMSALTLRLSAAASLIVLAAMSGCSASAAECQAEQKCNQLGTQTVSQCTTSGDQCISQLQQGNALCQDLATAIIDFDSCAPSLSCSDREIQNLNNSACTTQWGDMIGAAEDALSAGCPACGTAILSQTPDGGS